MHYCKNTNGRETRQKTETLSLEDHVAELVPETSLACFTQLFLLLDLVERLKTGMEVHSFECDPLGLVPQLPADKERGKDRDG